MGACQAGAYRPSGDLNCLFPSLTPLVLSPCPPDPASGRGCWVIQSPVSEVTPCRRAEGAEDTALLFNLSLTPFFSVSRTTTAVCCYLFVTMVVLKWSKYHDLFIFLWPFTQSLDMEVKEKDCSSSPLYLYLPSSLCVCLSVSLSLCVEMQFPPTSLFAALYGPFIAALSWLLIFIYNECSYEVRMWMQWAYKCNFHLLSSLECTA